MDQVFYFMSQALIFGKMKNWDKIKLNLVTCALCIVSATRGQGGSSSVGQLRLRDAEDGQDGGAAADDNPAPTGRARARSLSNASAALLDNLPELLSRMRPFLIMLGLIDLIKKTWQSRITDDDLSTIKSYHEKLFTDYLTKGNLEQVTEDSNLFYKVFNEQLTKIESVEKFVEVLGLKDRIQDEFGSIDKFVMSHF